jgi:hypothetical protein
MTLVDTVADAKSGGRQIKNQEAAIFEAHGLIE